MKNLGYMNGWSKTPDVVEKCKELGHREEPKEIGRCLNEYWCEECGYKYTIDSGG